MKDKVEYLVIDSGNISDLIEHEKNLHWAFKESYPEYAETFFKEVDKNRLVPNIPYDSQKIYVLKKNGEIVVAMSICHDNSIKYEVEEMGFSIDKCSHTVEALHFYDKHEVKSFEIIITAWRGLFDFLKADISKKGINKMYTSCSKKLLALYKYIGWDVVEEANILGGSEYLLSYKW